MNSRLRKINTGLVTVLIVSGFLYAIKYSEEYVDDKEFEG